MLLRRITEHVKAQNWTAVVLDFSIVVLGVFIGLQVANWNDARGDRVDEQRYLAELETDLGYALKEIDETIGNAQLRRAAGAFVFDGSGTLETDLSFRKMAESFAIPDHTEANPENYLPLIFSVSRVVDRHGDAYAELVATGKIGVLRDRSLVRGLSKYYSRYDEIQTGDEMNWNQMFRAQEMLQSRGISMTAQIESNDFIGRLGEDGELNAMAKNVAMLAVWQVMRLTDLRADTEEILLEVRKARQ